MTTRSSLHSVGVLAICLLVGSSGSAPVLAQPPYRQEILPGVSSLAISQQRARPRLADLDGDGDFDLTAGDLEGQLHYFVNVAGGAGLDFKGVPRSANPYLGIDVGIFCEPALADLDGDLDLDLVVGEGSGNGILYFENIGGVTAPSLVPRTGGANPFAGAASQGNGRGLDFGDLDGDGDLDLMAQAHGGTFHYYRNAGNAGTPAFVQLTGAANPFDGLSLPFGSSPDLADLDGDGDLDVVGGHSTGVYFLRNTGTPAAPAFVIVAGGASPFAGIITSQFVSPVVHDLDDDGDLDVLLGNAWGGFDTLFNVGTSTQPSFEAAGGLDPLVGLDAGDSLVPDFVDLDADGDRDMVALVQSGQNDLLRFFRNTGSSAFPVFVEQLGGADPFSSVGDMGDFPVVDLADIDGDDDLDALIGNFQGEGLGFIHYVRNIGSPATPSFVQGTPSEIFASGVGWEFTRTSPEFGDIDGDGDLDVVIGMTGSAMKYFENTGAPTAPSLIERFAGANPFLGVVPYETYPEILDYDGDGDADVIFTSSAGSLGLLENTGTAGAPFFVERTGNANPFVDVANGVGGLIDIEGDGDLDVLLGAGGGRLVFFRSSAAIFANGFESGDVNYWSFAVSAN